MTLEDAHRWAGLASKGYRLRLGLTHWSLYFGNSWTSRLVEQGVAKTDAKAIKAAIGAGLADLVKRRINGEKV